MYKVKITAVRKVDYKDLQNEYENPIAHACEVKEGDVWYSDGWNKPENFCDSAWESMASFVRALGCGGEDFYDGWMKNKHSAMISCNDGFRPVSFYIERVDH